jgi:hypothetical protein
MAYSGNTGGGGIFHKQISDPDKPEGTSIEHGGDSGSEGESTMTYVTNTWPENMQSTPEDADKNKN